MVSGEAGGEGDEKEGRGDAGVGVMAIGGLRGEGEVGFVKGR